jgi:hypothetical protein
MLEWEQRERAEVRLAGQRLDRLHPLPTRFAAQVRNMPTSVKSTPAHERRRKHVRQDVIN